MPLRSSPSVPAPSVLRAAVVLLTSAAIACSAESGSAGPKAGDSDENKAGRDNDAAAGQGSGDDGAPGACPYPTANCGAGAAGCATRLLDDPANCGRCGHDCLGGGCAAGQCQPTVVVPSTSLDGAIFPTDTKVWWVYWNAQSGYAQDYGGVVDLQTGATKEFGKPNEGTRILVADESAAYVAASGVRRIPVDGSASSTTLDVDTREAILVDSTFYFNSRKRTSVESSESGAAMIFSVPSGGGQKKLLASMSIDDSSGDLSGMRERDGFLYFIRGSESPSIVRIPSTGGAFEKVVSDPKLTALVGISGGAVYYTTFDTTIRIVRFDLASHQSAVIGTPIVTSSSAVNILMDDAACYWVDPNLGLRTLPLQGGVPVTIFQNGQTSYSSGGIGNLAQNARSLYWTVDGLGTAIFQLAK